MKHASVRRDSAEEWRGAKKSRESFVRRRHELAVNEANTSIDRAIVVLCVSKVNMDF